MAEGLFSTRAPAPRLETPASAATARHKALEQRPAARAQKEHSRLLSGRAIRPQPVQPAAPSSRNGLPEGLKAGVERLSGLSLDAVRVHYDSSRPAQLRAHAYTQGADIHLAPGQERQLPHEAWHVVQQAQGRVRPTLQGKGMVPINDDRGLEDEADRMGDKAMAEAGRALSAGGPTALDRDPGQALPASLRTGSPGAVQLRSTIMLTDGVEAPGLADGPCVQLATAITLDPKSKISNVTFSPRPSGFRKEVYEYLGFDKGDTPSGQNICHKDPWVGFTARYRQELIGLTISQAALHLGIASTATQEEVEDALWAKCLDKFNDLDNVELGPSSMNKSMGSITRHAKNLVFKDIDGNVKYPIKVSLPKTKTKRTINDSQELLDWATEMGVDSGDPVEVDDIVQEYVGAGCTIL